MAGLPVVVLRPFASAILSDSVCCRKMSFISNLFHLSLSFHWIEEVPLGANFVHGCLLPIYRCQLSSEARFTVDFPRRCPLPGILPCSLPRVGVRRYKPILQSCYHDFAPNPCGSRYQTAGSIGALARDEPVTPGVTFLSHPAPNSEDLNDR